ncbi:MAG: multidrug efflux pump subunit AcrB [Gammaproteobacteria bacterium]|jgi:multidrug efflux pump subunit AcrB
MANPAVRPIGGGGIARWSIRHPVGVSMAALAVLVLGFFALERLGVDLLPHLIYPEVRVRVLDRGVPAKIMEDTITRQLEEQLAITEDAISVQSRTSEGRSAVDLAFGYDKDIDIALRDASSRLDRAKRFLPDTVDPPIIYKLDPSQIPALEFIAGSRLRDPVELRDWVDHSFAKWFLNLPGVAAVEVGGAPQREISIEPDQERLAGHGLSLNDITTALQEANVESAGGSIRMGSHEINSRTAGRFATVEELAELALEVKDEDGNTRIVRLSEVAQIIDGHTDEKLRIRLDEEPGLKVSIQKQPQANTVAVAKAVKRQLVWLGEQQLIPSDINVRVVADQSLYVRQALKNAGYAALSGAFLAIVIIYIFLGDMRRTLIIATAIPLALTVTLILMAATGLTLNVMTLGGLALGVGLLVDNTIVMLENIYRHQRMGKIGLIAAGDAADEVNSAIIASTSTNLAAVLPFLFITGLIGLLFRELIATISTAIFASLVVAVTIVPALGARVTLADRISPIRRFIDAIMDRLGAFYAYVLQGALRIRWLIPIPFVVGLVFAYPQFLSDKQVFLPELDDGRISARVVADAGTSLNEMDRIVERLEAEFSNDPDVASLYSTIGGFVFGRSQYERSNRSRIYIQLVPSNERSLTSSEWAGAMRKRVSAMKMAGVRVRMRNDGIRGVRLGNGDDDLSLRVQGASLDELAKIGDELVDGLREIEGLKNIRHSAEDLVQELSVEVDRVRAADVGLSVESVAFAVRVALQGIIATDFIAGDRILDVRLRLPRTTVTSPGDVEAILLFPAASERPAVFLGDVASVELINAPADIRRDRQQRVIEVSATVTAQTTLGEANKQAQAIVDQLKLPAGYTVYDSGSAEALKEADRLTQALIGLALFLVLVVMAIQYESLRNPLIILVSVPFAAIGVAIGIHLLELPISMPLRLGIIMLAGIVVNNAIVLVEYIEIERTRGASIDQAIINAGRLRLRPILMTTLTTVIGMLPLAAGVGDGSELLRPLAIAMVCGLTFSTVVSLLLVPAVYRILGHRDRQAALAPSDSPSVRAPANA